ncbi:MAG: alpha/beta fold hydrolase, partial [Akkermansiaceae bacterium]|nr:alpha/beta fold hydrolase [Armatimonadota bacterium]
MLLTTSAAALAALLCTTAVALGAPATTAADKPVIVLVHGAFAEGSSWSKVIPLLTARGYRVVAVQNPYISLAGDVSATNRVVNQQPGQVVLVGHSSGGTVITQAGNNAKVGALVFVSANAPDSGQSINDLQAGMPAAPWAATLIKDEAGYLTLPEST